MKKYIGMISLLLLLAACSDENEKATWVAQNLPKEEKQPAPTYSAEVEVYSPNFMTRGQVIKQKEREKWILVNAQHVASHPNALIDRHLLTLGEIVAIDEVNNVAIIHIRNSSNYDVEPVQPFVTLKNGEQFTATVAQIESLLKQAVDEPIEWQQRYEKNSELLEGFEHAEEENFTTYYQKNTFTYNSDTLKRAALHLIDTLNLALKSKQYEELNAIVSSEDVKKEIAHITKPVLAFNIKEAKKEGVYYFVNGVDEEKKEVRLTFILENQKYKLIGSNLISSEALQDEKIAKMDVSTPKKLAELPALEMFVNKHLSDIKIITTTITWQLASNDKKIEVKKDGKTSYHCSEAQIQDNEFILIGCGPQKTTVPLVKFQ